MQKESSKRCRAQQANRSACGARGDPPLKAYERSAAFFAKPALIPKPVSPHA